MDRLHEEYMRQSLESAANAVLAALARGLSAVQNAVEKAKQAGIKLARLAMELERHIPSMSEPDIVTLRSVFASYDISFKA